MLGTRSCSCPSQMGIVEGDGEPHPGAVAQGGGLEGDGKPSVHTLDSVGTPSAASLEQASCPRPPSSAKVPPDGGCFKTHPPGKP